MATIQARSNHREDQVRGAPPRQHRPKDEEDVQTNRTPQAASAFVGFPRLISTSKVGSQPQYGWTKSYRIVPDLDDKGESRQGPQEYQYARTGRRDRRGYVEHVSSKTKVQRRSSRSIFARVGALLGFRSARTSQHRNHHFEDVEEGTYRRHSRKQRHRHQGRLGERADELDSMRPLRANQRPSPPQFKREKIDRKMIDRWNNDVADAQETATLIDHPERQGDQRSHHDLNSYAQALRSAMRSSYNALDHAGIQVINYLLLLLVAVYNILHTSQPGNAPEV